MRSFAVRGQTLGTALIALGVGMAVAPSASADPADPDQPQPPGPVAGALPEAAAAPSAAPDDPQTPGVTVGPTGTTQGTDPAATPVQSSGEPTKDACDLFNK